MSVFGDYVLPFDVDNGVVALLKTWMPTYLRSFDVHTGRAPGKLPNIQAWGLAEIETGPDARKTPALSVESAQGTPLGKANGYGTVLDTRVAFICRSEMSMGHVRELSQIYAFAAAKILVSQPLAVEGQVLGVQLDGPFEFGILSAQTRRYLGRGEIPFTIEVPLAFTSAGPIAPDTDDDYPLVEGADLTVDDVQLAAPADD